MFCRIGVAIEGCKEVEPLAPKSSILDKGSTLVQGDHVLCGGPGGPSGPVVLKNGGSGGGGPVGYDCAVEIVSGSLE